MKPEEYKKLGPVDDLLAILKRAGFPDPVREYEFFPSRKWRFDCAWVDVKIALEFEGAAHTGGRHTRGPGYTSDCVKYSRAAICGWIVIRVVAEHIKAWLGEDCVAVTLLRDAFNARKSGMSC